jgi:hypothetical protein
MQFYVGLNFRNFPPILNNIESFTDVNLDSIHDAKLALKGSEKAKQPSLEVDIQGNINQPQSHGNSKSISYDVVHFLL